MRVLSFVLTCAISVASAASAEPEKLEHPGVVALSQSEKGEWIYRKFPSSLRLYVSERDAPGRSNCAEGCSSAWPPVLAAETDLPVGDWTPILRGDGRRQWAYKGRPAYLRYHDAPEAPQGDGIDGFKLLKP